MSVADLHVHTFFSDSSSSPQKVVEEALGAGLSGIAITDHDTLEGIHPTLEASRGVSIEVIPGIELSCECESCDIHMLGYFIDGGKGSLAEKIKLFQDARLRRMKQMIMNLRTVGVDDIEFEEVSLLTKSHALGRLHLALLLQQKGHVTSIKEAFDKYLGLGCPGYVSKYQMTPMEAITLIQSSGGVAVMAHPMLTQKDELIPRLVKAGLKGLEVYYPNCIAAVTQFYERIAHKHGLIATGGSDDHGRSRQYTYIGKATVPYAVVEQLRQARVSP